MVQGDKDRKKEEAAELEKGRRLCYDFLTEEDTFSRGVGNEDYERRSGTRRLPGPFKI
jgi:hypothetical protein